MITKDSFLHIVRGGLGQTKCLSLGRTERERDMRVGRYGTNSKPKKQERGTNWKWGQESETHQKNGMKYKLTISGLCTIRFMQRTGVRMSLNKHGWTKTETPATNTDKHQRVNM